MELDYEKTIAADMTKELEKQEPFKGKFEKVEMENIEFVNDNENKKDITNLKSEEKIEIKENINNINENKNKEENEEKEPEEEFGEFQEGYEKLDDEEDLEVEKEVLLL